MSEDDTTKATPTFNYAVELYELMESRSELVHPNVIRSFGYPKELNEEVRIFRGTVRALGNEIGLIKGMAQKSSSLLQNMNCITILKRGGSYGSVSYYLLNYKPTLEDFFNFKENTFALNRSINPTKSEKLVNDVAQLLERYNELLGRVVYLEKVVSELKVGNGHNV